MPGFICAVAICKSNSEKAKKSGQHISFHSFPSDMGIRKEWVRRCHRKDMFDPKHKKVCSMHFTVEDYEDAIQAQIMNVVPKRLRKQAIPTLNLMPKAKETTKNLSKSSKRSIRYQKREQAQLVKNILDESESNDPVFQQVSEDVNTDNNNLPGCSGEIDYEELKRAYDALVEEHNAAKQQISELNLRNLNLQKENESVTKHKRCSC
ncbi:hypothetical protein NQ315_002063 [Exocentrus adspersus]|uniref:THAP-type domain-containing protein n=1 Tax=Exocentrus adspersus TaxID=1586481 RepID=A0AAV8VGR6_9CUCU|nr:hypothetical protein NQ315_002063 [Exocentrus adspersus]